MKTKPASAGFVFSSQLQSSLKLTSAVLQVGRCDAAPSQRFQNVDDILYSPSWLKTCGNPPIILPNPEVGFITQPWPVAVSGVLPPNAIFGR